MCHTDFVQILISQYWCSVHSGTWHLRKVMVNCFTTFIFVHLNKTSHEFWGSWRCACMHCWSWYLRLNNLTASYLFNIYVWSVIRLLLQLISSIIICVTGKGHPKLKKSHAVFFFVFLERMFMSTYGVWQTINCQSKENQSNKPWHASALVEIHRERRVTENSVTDHVTHKQHDW